MPKRLIPVILLLCSVSAEAAQPSNATYRLVQDGFVPAGGRATNAQFTLQGGEFAGVVATAPAPVTARRDVSGTTDDSNASILVQGAGEEQIPAAIIGNAFVAQGVLLKLGPNTLTVRATDQVGNTRTVQCQVILDLPPEDKTMRFHYRVTGETDPSAVAVSVNSRPATLSQNSYAADIDLTTGLNTVTAMVQDAAGNSTDETVRVFVPLPTLPPAMPTVGTIGPDLPSFTTASEITVGGTNVAGTTVWVNGRQATVTSDTTWTITLSLQEGDNILRVVAKDALGVSSAEAVRNVVVDNAPPVIAAANVTTNFNPYTFTGTVDDSLTIVSLNGATAQRSGTAFSLSLPLAYGANTVAIEAASPRNLRSSKTVTVALGHVPTINNIAPPDGRLLYFGRPAALQVAATDAENDPRDYQLLRNDVVIKPWGSQGTLSWTPAAGDLGAHLLRFEARDAYGGSDQQQAEVLVIREPVPPPVQP